MASVLARTPTGRLYRNLVINQQLAQSVSASQQGRGFSGEFHVSGISQDVAVAGGRAYLTEINNPTLYVVDVTSPAQPAAVGGG